MQGESVNKERANYLFMVKMEKSKEKIAMGEIRTLQKDRFDNKPRGTNSYEETPLPTKNKCHC
jgi:hypothetical protein